MTSLARFFATCRGVLMMLVIATFLCAGAADTMAAPPPNADGTYQAWFRNLRQPQTGVSCCSIADCRMTEYRAGQDGYEVLFAGRWLPVPQDKILRGIENPTGRAVLCAHPDGEILCFVTPEES